MLGADCCSVPLIGQRLSQIKQSYYVIAELLGPGPEAIIRNRFTRVEEAFRKGFEGGYILVASLHSVDFKPFANRYVTVYQCLAAIVFAVTRSQKRPVGPDLSSSAVRL